MTIATPRCFGWKPNPPDARDRVHARRAGLVRTEGRSFELLCPPLRDQLDSSSCVGNGTPDGVELAYAIAGRPIRHLSALHAYWLARAQDGFQHEDGGAYIRSCLQAMRKVGCCSDATLPFDTSRINERPPMEAEIEGVAYADFSYENVAGGAEGGLDSLQTGHPLVIGGDVTSAFVFASGPDTIPAPKPGDVYQGGHCFLIVAFDRHGERVLARNSWGKGWGLNGYAWLDAGWLEAPRTSDLVAITAVAANGEAP